MSRYEAGSPPGSSGEFPTDAALERLSLLAEVLTPIEPAPAIRAELLQKLRGPERWTQHARPIAEGFGLPLSEVLDALRQIANPAAWRPGLWPGSRQLSSAGLAAAYTFIAELPAGFSIVHHKHAARELTYVLDGELVENGRIHHGGGAFMELSRGSEHAVAAAGHSPCLVVWPALLRASLPKRVIVLRLPFVLQRRLVGLPRAKTEWNA